MNPQLYWQEKWDKGETPWQKTTVHPFLIETSKDLDFTPQKRVLLPLCGKCQELLWFYEKGLEVVGVDMIDKPVKDFFKENNLQVQVKELSWAKVYETPNERLRIYVSNIFDINFDNIGKFDIIWDKGVHSSIEIVERERYSKLMRKLCKKEFIYMLVTMQFDVDTDAPPRPLSHEETQKIFGDWCKIKLVKQIDITTPYFQNKGFQDAKLSYHLLTPK